MPNQTHDTDLAGCAPEPLMAYLKALGVLRLIAEQKDVLARGWWQQDVFVLRSRLDAQALVNFFLRDYRPTPIVAPWAGGSGFFDKDNKKAVDAVANSMTMRLADYRSVVATVRDILNMEGVASKPSDETKVRLLQRYRRELPLSVVDWMDAAMVLHESGQGFAPLLGTGGNDGRLDFTQNFMSRLITLGVVEGKVNELSEEWLRSALFGTPARQLGTAAVGQFAPGRAGGPNATQGMEGGATDNPWDSVLMLEGTLVLAGAAARRMEPGDVSRVSFPFTVRHVAAGYHSAAENDDQDSRGEIWLPLWGRPATIGELRTLFAEGRADVSGRPARHGLDFARAAATLGVDRGIRLFSRYSFLKRSGKAYLALPLGRFEVRARGEVDLLREIDPWLDSFRRVAVDKNAPPRFRSALRRIDQAILGLCRYGGKTHLQSVLLALGRAERELALTVGKVGNIKETVRPLCGLSDGWITQSDDGSQEFAIARALASVYDAEHKIGPLRVNLEPVSLSPTQGGRLYARWLSDEKDPERRRRAVVWNAAGLAANISAALERRCMDGQRAGCQSLPLAASASAGLGAVAAFINAEVDDAKIEELLWGLVLVDNSRASQVSYNSATKGGLVPRAYALLKLLFLPDSVMVERRDDGVVRIRALDRGEEGVRVKPEPEVLHLLRASRLGEACVRGMRRLRASGFSPVPRPVLGRRVRDDDWYELQQPDPVSIDPRRLAASLLIPISRAAISALGSMITNPDTSEGILAVAEDTQLSISG